MGSVWRSVVDMAKSWADRRVARQAEVEDVPGVDEPKEIPNRAAEPPPADRRSGPDKRR